MTQLLVVFIILCYSLTLTLSSSVHHKVQPLHSSGNNETCITITVYDLFGDDWGGVKLYIETPKTPVPALSPNCTNNPVIKHICGEKGQYYFMALNGDDELPDFSWEVIWTVEFDANGQLFTGGFNTTMVFDYSDHMWSLIHHQNIWENEQNLISCSSSQDLSSEHCASEPYHSSPNAPVSNKGQRQSSKNKKSAAPVAGKMIGKIHRGLEAEKNGRRDISTTKAPKRAAVVVSAPKARVNIKDGSEEEFSNVPTFTPTFIPTFEPTFMPTFEPTFMPTFKPSPAPSPTNMTRPPTGIPSGQPTDQPSGQPTGLPTSYPTEDEEGGGEAAVMRKKIRRERQRIEIRKKIAGGESESDEPTVSPTPIPTVNPTYLPTTRPTVLPTFKPSPAPSPTNMTRPPTGIPSGQPTDQPSGQPSGQPSAVPTTEIENEAVRSPVREKPKIMKFERTLKKAKPTKAVESPSPVELKVTMSSPCGDGWFDKHYEGTMFHIADESKKELIAYGTLASGSYLGYCEYCFGEGSYYFRVTADHQCHDAKWSFCGTTGSYSEQLSFHIEDGECIPDALVDLEMICKESYSSVVIVSGKLALTGFSSEIFSKKDKYVIAQALSMTVPGWDTDNIVIEHLNLNFRISKQNERSLLPFTLEVSFEVSFVPEIAYEYESTSYSGIEELVEKLKDILVDATSYGEFSSNLRSSASSAGDRQLATIRGTELLELDLMDVIYVGTKHMYHIDTDEDLETTDNSLRYFSTVMSEMTTDNTFHQVILVAILAVGLVSFMGATVYSLRARRYEDLISKFVDPSESEHGSSFLTKSKKPLVNNLVGVGCDAR
eukprot:gene1539-2969_t